MGRAVVYQLGLSHKGEKARKLDAAMKNRDTDFLCYLENDTLQLRMGNLYCSLQSLPKYSVLAGSRPLESWVKDEGTSVTVSGTLRH